jgi:flavin-dependent dehydrogenase
LAEAPPSPIDLLVIGAGPAGARAALRAQACGLDVLLVDENSDAGGQVRAFGPRPKPYRATPCVPN